MANKTEVSNTALMRIGVSQRLTDVDTDDTVESNDILTVFDVERKYTLRDFPWPFARKYITLTLASDPDVPPNADWLFSYRYPTDCLQVRRIVDCFGRQNCSPAPYVIGRDPLYGEAADWSSGTAYVIGDLVRHESVVYKANANGTNHEPPNSSFWTIVDPRLIFTNQEDAAIEYTVNVEDVGDFDDIAASMLAWRIAVQLAPALSRMVDIVKHCQDSYKEQKGEAIARALAEGEYAVASGEPDPRVRDIFNLALTRLGIARNAIAVDPELNFAVLWPRVCFHDERDYVLRDFAWGFARGYKDLLLVSGSFADPYNDDWIFAYRYPVDALAIRRIVTPNGQRETNPPPFKIARDRDVQDATTWTATAFDEGDVVTSGGKFYQALQDTTDEAVTDEDFWQEIDSRILLTSYAEEVTVEITEEVTDPNEFDAMFLSMMAWRLAGLLAPSIAKIDKDGQLAARALQMYEIEKGRAQRAAYNEGQDDKDEDAEWIRER